ncbi:hypothetical protein PPL_04063 [Heterostelium album PN500]|uniref:Uncharacterized protein n=1 Tax=Heterostelium pallidum (strain ATCC 26659 / Pp 5 / PN500) TaxID=670386 RepID=D3B5X5_HETP5|nr:hypothetical protein PPL_04063 [Heterostelium album PN500]EFA83273.1 hypothetical protein PPL_04063 [Heterostelium album PN500]|eukprot:XP_020435390.1 hypothetical protein PPL_04063 [Heterostelium album PN500]
MDSRIMKYDNGQTIQYERELRDRQICHLSVEHHFSKITKPSSKSMDQLLNEQQQYYNKRSWEYDKWWNRVDEFHQSEYLDNEFHQNKKPIFEFMKSLTVGVARPTNNEQKINVLELAPDSYYPTRYKTRAHENTIYRVEYKPETQTDYSIERQLTNGDKYRIVKIGFSTEDIISILNSVGFIMEKGDTCAVNSTFIYGSFSKPIEQ